MASWSGAGSQLSARPEVRDEMKQPRSARSGSCALGRAAGRVLILCCSAGCDPQLPMPAPSNEVDAAPVCPATGEHPAEWTLDNICTHWPVQVCRRIEACCRFFDARERCDCQEEYRTTCEAHVWAARSGRLVFRPERVNGCLSAVNEICYASPIGRERDLLGCPPIFEGDHATGEPCETSADCRQPEDDRARARCFTGWLSSEEPMCVRFEVRGEGEACVMPLNPSESVRGQCADGLYCKAPAGMPDLDQPGTCEPYLPVGEPCPDNRLYAPDLSGCAPPGECNRGVCVDSGRRLAGEPCTAHEECFYRHCKRGQCMPPTRSFCGVSVGTFASNWTLW
jgi:hypothetical protein